MVALNPLQHFGGRTHFVLGGNTRAYAWQSQAPCSCEGLGAGIGWEGGLENNKVWSPGAVSVYPHPRIMHAHPFGGMYCEGVIYSRASS